MSYSFISSNFTLSEISPHDSFYHFYQFFVHDWHSSGIPRITNTNKKRIAILPSV